MNKELWTAADVIDYAFGRELPEHARTTVNNMAALALDYPHIWELFCAFIEANRTGEVKPEPRH